MFLFHRLHEEPHETHPNTSNNTTITSSASFTSTLAFFFDISDTILLSTLYLGSLETLSTAEISLFHSLQTCLTTYLPIPFASSLNLPALIPFQINSDLLLSLLASRWCMEILAIVIQKWMGVPLSGTWYGYLKSHIHPMITSFIGLWSDVFFLLLINK
jgi:hypothetical protein